MADLAVIILTYNEEVHIQRALASVSSFAREIFVVDSFSSDRTVEVAEANGATVLRNKFVNQSKQFQWALDNAPITSAWVMRLDADEIVEPELAAEIASKLPNLSSDIVGVHLKRKHIFFDRWIRYGGRYPLLLLRIWRRGSGTVEDRWMDEHVIVWGGKTITFEGNFADHNLNDLTFFTEKHNRYATREAIDVLTRRLKLSVQDKHLTLESHHSQAGVKRLIKQYVYNRIPFQVSAICYFLYRYFVKLGFLDGKEGLIYHCLQGFWYRFLVGAKIHELERSVAHLKDPNEIKDEIARLTGFQIE